MKAICVVAMSAAALVLAGCGSILEREYETVKPHASQYWEDATASVLRAEDYTSLVNGLLVLVSEQTDAGIVRLYGYADKAAALREMDQACAEVTLEDPLGAYLVEYMTYDCAEGTNCFEITVKLTYQKTPAQLRALVNATTAGAVPELLSAALREGKTELAVKVGYMDRSAAEIETAVAECMAAAGREEGSWSVQYYPDAGGEGDARIVEILWQPPEGPVLPETLQQPPALPQD